MDKKNQPNKCLWPRLKRYLFAGTLVVAPAFITLYTAVWLINIVDRWVKSMIPARFYPEIRILGIPGVGVVCLLLLLIIVGFLTANWIGKTIVSLTDRIFSGTPVLSSLYSTLKQLFHSFLGDSTTAFRQVVLVEFPRDGCWSIGFVTGPFEQKPPGVTEDMFYVFVPTTPNPTNGFLLQLPQSKIHKADMTVEQGLKAVVSMGMTK